EGYEQMSAGTARFSIRGVEVRLAVGGRHQAMNAAAALAACEFAGVPISAGAEALADVRIEHRLQERITAAGFSVVDDAYNASPESIIAAFDTLSADLRRGVT